MLANLLLQKKLSDLVELKGIEPSASRVRF
jgi:hypothetical protein